MAERAIGGIPEAEIEEHYKVAGLSDDAGAGRAIRFLRLLADLVARRCAIGEAADGAIFLLAERVAEVMKTRSGVSRPALVTGNDEISGRVWAVNARLANAHELEMSWITGGGFQTIVDAGLGELPAVAIDLRNPTTGPQALFFPDGCGNPDAMLQIHLGEDPISADHMRGTLDDFYEQNLRTPMTVLAGHGDRIWKEAGNGVPNPRPEETIEMLLLRHLRSVYFKHTTRAQTPTDDGYLDIALDYVDRTVQGHPAKRCDWVLELKDLANRTSTDRPSSANVPAAISKGLLQTVAYSDAQPSLRRALCIYDLRDVANDDVSCFDHVRDDAEHYEVHLWRWRLLRSAEEGREQRYPLLGDARRRSAHGGA